MILGLNKYTHSAAACLLDASGKILFAQAKERITRKKHDGGDVAELVRYALERSGRKLRDIELVVQNNHLFSIPAYERQLPFLVAQHAVPPSGMDAHNLLAHAQRVELSHHLAHAWSVAAVAPYSQGLILVMDGMGSPRELARAPGTGDRFTDGNLRRHPNFREYPAGNLTGAWREGESVYEWRNGALRLLWKRWIQERTPSFLYNFGFENMESLGAVYSRVSSHIFGDWNQCGKVMGLAAYGDAKRIPPLVSGPLETLRVDWETIASLPFPNAWNEKRHRRSYADLAARVQWDLEKTTLDFLRRLRRKTGSKHLAFTGGVALNSLLNGRIAAESGFENFFVPPYPGDEGVAVGCAYFGRQKISRRATHQRPPSAYTGGQFSESEMAQAFEEFAPWIEVETPRAHIDAVARELAAHRFVAWFQGASEFGPRALGHRSILAHPGRRATWKSLNESVKKREAFRPFAPVVRESRAAEFFKLCGDSRYMSLTVPALAAARRQLRAVVHIDGSSRIQTLHREDNVALDDLLLAFEKRTGLPVLLNTSFNIEGEPIVESPADAIRSLLDSQLHLLVLGQTLVRKKVPPTLATLRRLAPQAIPDAIVERRSLADGSPSGAQLSVRGRVHEIGEIDILCLESAQGRATCARLIREIRAMTGAKVSEIEKSFLRLWKLRAIRF